MKFYSDLQFLNVGSGEDITIADFARLIADVVGFRGKIEFDASRPDGAPQKLLDVSRINALGWRAQTPLRDGLQRMYADFLPRDPELRQRAEDTAARSTVVPGP